MRPVVVAKRVADPHHGKGLQQAAGGDAAHVDGAAPAKGPQQGNDLRFGSGIVTSNQHIWRAVWQVGIHHVAGGDCVKGFDHFGVWQQALYRFTSRVRMPNGQCVSDPQAAVAAAISGIGIAQTGLHHAWQYLKTGELKIVLAKQHDSGRRAMALQYPHRALVAPRVRATVEFLLQELGRTEALHVPLDQLHMFAA